MKPIEYTDEQQLKFRTKCADCVFAEFTHDDELGDTFQTGCDLNRLNKFKALGLATQSYSDLDKNSYIIKTVCNAFRDEKWADQFYNEGVLLDKQVQKEIEVPCDFIILSCNDTNWYNNITYSSQQCLKQKTKPRNIVFVINGKNMHFTDNIYLKSHTTALQKLYRELHERFANTLVYVMRVADEINELGCINEAFKKVRSPYYAVWQAGHTIPENHIQNLNNWINRNLRRISMVKPKSYLHGLTIQSRIHKFFKGNKNGPLHDTIINLAEYQNQESMVMSYEEFSSYGTDSTP